MVISLEIDERKMGNRGSKSDSIICKRATSRWFFSYYSCKVYSSRRETDSWEKNIFVLFSWLVAAVFLGVNVGLLSNWSELTELSNQYIFGDSFFSINLDLIPALIPFSYDTQGSKTNSYYITGLVDGEGSFGIYLTKYNKSKAGYSIQPNFQITLHKNDYALLETIKLYFYVGSIYKDGESLYKFSVRSLKDLEIILKHFDKYPLHTQKRADYELFKQVVLMLLNKRHFTEEGLLKIIAIKAAMNKGLSESLKTAFPDLIPVTRPVVIDQEIKYPNWLVGFSEAEACFLVVISKSPKNKFGKRVMLRFTITQHARDVELLKNIITFLDCGVIQSNLDSTKKVAVSKFSDITEKIIPFFDKYPLKGTKAKDYSDFKKVANLIENKIHLTQSGLDEIARIKARMNSAIR